jgi:7,8-dihydropterin-6-yl-methyl-4-(beta-D-ribofuranosyl)aminobenzene 5'-phosphate synthase
MKRRDLLAAGMAMPASSLVLTGCAAPGTKGTDAVANPGTARLTVLFDAFGRDPALQKDWGYAAFLEAGGKRILFDTGNDAEVLAKNAAAKKVDLARLDFVVMSHRHGDHMGGMAHVLSVNPKVKIYAPKEGFGVYGSDLPSAFYRKDDTLAPHERYFGGSPPAILRFGKAWPQADIALIDKTTEIAPGVHAISLVSDKPGTLELRELSLAVATPEGLVVLVGCSHAGIDKIVQAAAALDPRVHLVAGGFHLVVAKDSDIEGIVATLRDTLKVHYVAPGHCTGEPTFTALKKAFGERYVYAGLGTTLSLAGVPRAVAETAAATALPPDDDDLASYRALLASSNKRRWRLFANLRPGIDPGGAYLGSLQRTWMGCC